MGDRIQNCNFTDKNPNQVVICLCKRHGLELNIGNVFYLLFPSEPDVRLIITAWMHLYWQFDQCIDRVDGASLPVTMSDG